MTEKEELLLAIQSIVRQETEPLTKELQKINIRLDTEIGDKLDSLADGFMSLDERTDRIEKRLDKIEPKLGTIADDVAAIKTIVSEHDEEITELKQAQ